MAQSMYTRDMVLLNEVRLHQKQLDKKYQLEKKSGSRHKGKNQASVDHRNSEQATLHDVHVRKAPPFSELDLLWGGGRNSSPLWGVWGHILGKACVWQSKIRQACTKPMFTS